MTDIPHSSGSDVEMMLLITYDVSTITDSGKRRLAKVARLCSNYGQRVQNSVFECDLDNAKYVEFKGKLLKLIDEKQDSLRIYNLGNNYNRRIEQFGVKISYDPEGELIF